MEPLDMLDLFVYPLRKHRYVGPNDYIVVGSMALWLNGVDQFVPSDVDVVLRPSKRQYFPVFPDCVDNCIRSLEPADKEEKIKAKIKRTLVDDPMFETEMDFNSWFYLTEIKPIQGLQFSLRILTLAGCHAFYIRLCAKYAAKPKLTNKWKTKVKLLESMMPRLRMPTRTVAMVRHEPSVDQSAYE